MIVFLCEKKKKKKINRQVTKLTEYHFGICYLLICVLLLLIMVLFEPRRKKTGYLHMRKQRRRSASR